MTGKRKFASGSSKRTRKEREERLTQSLRGSVNRYVKPTSTSILDESLLVNDENINTCSDEVLSETIIVDNDNLNHGNADESLEPVVDNVVNDEFVTENQDVNIENLDILLDPGNWEKRSEERRVGKEC